MRISTLIFLVIFKVSNLFADSSINELNKQVKVKVLLSHLVENKYQNNYIFLYDNPSLSKKKAFNVIDQKERKIGEDIFFLEKYFYYNIRITIYKISENENGQIKNFYLMMADISGNNMAFELLLFDETGKFLSSYQYGSKFIEGESSFNFQSIGEKVNILAIVTNTSSAGSYSEYLTLLFLKNNKFVEIKKIIIYSIESEKDSNILTQRKYKFEDLNNDGFSEFIVTEDKGIAKLDPDNLKTFDVIKSLSRVKKIFFWDKSNESFTEIISKP